MEPPVSVEKVETSKQGMGCMSILGLMLLTVVISVAVTIWVINVYLFPKQFEPVELSSTEQQVLERKLEVFEAGGTPGSAGREVAKEGDTLQPVPYSEEGANRSLSLTERELNGILAKNTDLADKLVLDLSDGLVSARLRLPMDPDFPFFGGRTLKARAGLEVSYAQENPIVILKGVSVMGVPIPNAWLGGLKNIDLVGQFGQSEGFWKTFSDGIDHVQVLDGALQINLKE